MKPNLLRNLCVVLNKHTKFMHMHTQGNHVQEKNMLQMKEKEQDEL